MFCYIVFEKSSNKQLRVFSYNPLMFGDWERAQNLARNMAKDLHDKGYPCIVERMAACPVGSIDFDSAASMRTGNLSDRIRPNAEASQWVCEEVRKLEQRYLTLLEALHQVSLCSQNSTSIKEECGRIARAAIAKATGELK